MLDVILNPALIVAGIGLVASLLLVFASAVMGTKVNEKEAAVRDCLPGANCGACGFSGCDAYANAVAENGAEPNLCRPGGAEVAGQVAAILGVEAAEVAPVVAFVHCGGDCAHNGVKAEYSGINSCAAAKMLYGGKGACSAGCLGCGDCAKVCPADAICVENGLAHVDPRRCIGCGLCTKECPNRLISLIPKTSQSAVVCSNHEKGAFVRKECSHGCIGCMKCQKNCPVGAITVENNLASVDYSKCVGCGTCVANCPVGCLELHKI